MKAKKNESLPKKTKRKVRCLGLGKEHTFESEGASNRICPRCRFRLQEMRVSRRDEFQHAILEE